MSSHPKILPLLGLRAVATAWVVAFHYQLPHADGGFVGVDLFFVLSGYLITTLLLRELTDAGTIDLVAFFRRRAARLAPALCLVVLATSIAMICLPVDIRAGTWRDLPWVLSYTSNWKRAFIDRFGDSVFFNHSWSLSVEEQFYVTWPLVLAATHRRWSERGVVVASLLGIVGVMWWRLALLASGAAHYRLYHGFDTRADQLLVGCALAAAMSIDTYRKTGLDILRRYPLLPFVALALLPCVGASSPTDSMILYSMGLPTIGLLSALVIVACHVADGPLARLLSRRILVRLGTISYGIYLWHIPLKSFFLVGGLGFEVPQRLACLGLTIVFATASYLGIERRFLSQARRPHASMLSPPKRPRDLAGNAPSAWIGASSPTFGMQKS